MDIYTPRVLDKIAEAIGGCTDRKLDWLGCDLAMAAELAVVVEEETDIAMTKAKRIAWIKENLLVPLAVLREGLAVEHAPKTSSWPYSQDLDEIDCSHADDFEHEARSLHVQLRKMAGEAGSEQKIRSGKLPRSRTRRQKIVVHLDWLDEWARSRIDLLSAEKMKPATVRRHMFVEAVVRLYAKHFPERDQAGIRADGRTMLGDFVRAAAAPVLGDNNLTAQIKRAVSIVRPDHRARMAETKAVGENSGRKVRQSLTSRTS